MQQVEPSNLVGRIFRLDHHIQRGPIFPEDPVQHFAQIYFQGETLLLPLTDRHMVNQVREIVPRMPCICILWEVIGGHSIHVNERLTHQYHVTRG